MTPGNLLGTHLLTHVVHGLRKLLVHIISVLAATMSDSEEPELPLSREAH